MLSDPTQFITPLHKDMVKLQPAENFAPDSSQHMTAKEEMIKSLLLWTETTLHINSHTKFA
jgi:hypothetical protein